MKPYKIIVFSTSKEASGLEDNELEEVAEDISKQINKEGKKVGAVYADL